VVQQHSYPSLDKLSTLLGLIHDGLMALPDFQRDFVWDPGMTDELLESLIQNFPAGTLLRVKNGQDLLFKPRAFEGAPDLDHKRPTFLVLDGQQRLTSLYQALYGVGRHRFVLDLGALERGDELEDATFYLTASKFEKEWGSIERQAEELVFPLARVFGGGGFAAWSLEVLASRASSPEAMLELNGRLSALRTQWLEPLEQYQFPVVEIHEKTSAEAICTIFETLNRTGVRLSVFDLLTARFWPHDVNLRESWEQAIAEFPILEEFDIDPWYVLQIMALLEPGKDSDGQPRPPSVKVKDVLALSPEAAKTAWPRAIAGLAAVLDIFQTDCGVVAPRWLPYFPMIVAPAAAWSVQAGKVKGPIAGANRARIVRWFWCASFGQRYEYAVNSQIARDYQQLVSWMTDEEAPAPETVTGLEFAAGSLRITTPRQRSLYRATMALVLRNQPRDFHKRGPITSALFADSKNPVDDHHVFPAGYLAKAVSTTSRDSILNRTLIDRQTNIRIGKRAPSAYLQEIAGGFDSEKEFAALLRSHHLPTGAGSPLMLDDFEGFLSWREVSLTEQIEQVTGTLVTRTEPEPSETGLDV
jgi:hypothetical protein